MTTTRVLGTLTTAAADTAVVVIDRHYATDAADLWDAVTDPDRISQWFAPVSGAREPGDAFTLAFDDGEVGPCRVVDCHPPRSFAWEWPHGTRVSLVQVTIVPDGDGARLRLTHTRLPLGPAPQYAAGWDAFVRRLDDHVDGREVSDRWFEDFASAVTEYTAQRKGLVAAPEG